MGGKKQMWCSEALACVQGLHLFCFVRWRGREKKKK